MACGTCKLCMGYLINKPKDEPIMAKPAVNLADPTNALETLGKILTSNPGRDAIHLATVAVTANRRLFPGDHVGLVPNENRLADTKDVEPIGIVDPFLAAPVMEGQMFWLIIYPRMITSLRHVWTHPSFKDEITDSPASWTDAAPAISNEKMDAIEYFKEYLSYDDYDSYGMDSSEFSKDSPNPSLQELTDLVTSFAERALQSDGDEYLHISGQDASGGIPPEFWDHVFTLTGRRPSKAPTYFSCSC